jgi:hypothetical protein
MKKIILIIFASLMFANIGFAEITLIEEKLIKGKIYKNTISTVCIDGYKFVYIKSGSGTGQSLGIVQFMRQHKFDLLPVPEKC